MNKKGIIFTMDALIALTVFIAVVLITYSTFTPDQAASTQTSSIYAISDNFIRALDKSEKLSEAFKTRDFSELEELVLDFPYEATLRLYERSVSGELYNVTTINEQEYGNSIVIRKFLVLSLQGINVNQSTCTNLTMWDCIPDRNQTGNIEGMEIIPDTGIIKNPFNVFLFYDRNTSVSEYCTTEWTPNLTMNISSAPDTLPDGWETEPAFMFVNYSTTPDYDDYWTMLDPNGCEWLGTFDFNLTINSSKINYSDIGEHEINMTIDLIEWDPPCYMYYLWLCTYIEPFHILRYGLVEFEVGTI